LVLKRKKMLLYTFSLSSKSTLIGSALYIRGSTYKERGRGEMCDAACWGEEATTR